MLYVGVEPVTEGGTAGVKGYCDAELEVKMSQNGIYYFTTYTNI
jgi:hypothetical protein